MKIKRSVIVLYNGSSKMKKNRLLDYKNKRYLELVLESVSDYEEIIIANQNSECLENFKMTGRMIKKEHITILNISRCLKKCKYDEALVISCDIPMVKKELLNELGNINFDESVLMTYAKGRPQPLCAVYKKSMISHLESMINNDNASLPKLFNAVSVRYIFPREQECFINIETIERYAKLSEKELLRRRRRHISLK